jgi:endonuclease/exonuclease/phosphatase family metal-dependent hydrolase
MIDDNNILKMLQWNCQGLQSSLMDLEEIIRQQGPDIICLQETWHWPGKCPHIEGFRVFDCPRNREDSSGQHRGGVLIAVKDSCTSIHSLKVKLAISSDRCELICITGALPTGESINICSVYWPTNDYRIEHLEDELGVVVRGAKMTAVFGDFNARHKKWDCKQNKAGNELKNFVDLNQLYFIDCINFDKLITFRGHAGTSHVDLALTNNPTMFTLKEVVNSHLCNSSDHDFIMYEARVTASPEQKNKFINQGKAVKLFAEYHPATKCPPQELAADLMEIVEKSSFKIRKGGQGGSTKWWNSECTDANNLRKKTRKRFNRSHSAMTFAAMRLAQQNFHYKCNEAKKNLLINTSNVAEKGSKELYKLIQSNCKKKQPPLR